MVDKNNLLESLAITVDHLRQHDEEGLQETADFLEELQLKIRSPNVVFIIEHLLNRPPREHSFDEYHKRGLAQAAVYILVHRMGWNVTSAAKYVSDFTHIKWDTLRAALKGKNKLKFDDTMLGKRTQVAIDYIESLGCHAVEDEEYLERIEAEFSGRYVSEEISAEDWFFK